MTTAHKLHEAVRNLIAERSDYVSMPLGAYLKEGGK